MMVLWPIDLWALCHVVHSTTLDDVIMRKSTDETSAPYMDGIYVMFISSASV